MVLAPNDRSILAFVKALKHSKVPRHITKLTYDGRFGSLFSVIRRIPPDLNLPYPLEERAKVMAWLDHARSGHFRPYEDMTVEVACLAKVLHLLPNLKKVCIRECEDGSAILATLQGPIGESHYEKEPSFVVNEFMVLSMCAPKSKRPSPKLVVDSLKQEKGVIALERESLGEMYWVSRRYVHDVLRIAVVLHSALIESPSRRPWSSTFGTL